MADAVQAYLQAKMRGDACWIELPPDARPGHLWGPNHLPEDELRIIKEVWSAKKVPVVPMECALYGHPDSVSVWQEHCNAEIRLVDFIPIGAEWP